MFGPHRKPLALNKAITFNLALSFVLGQEGGYANVKGDPGGPTDDGITQAEYDVYRQAQGLLHQSVRFLSVKEEDTLYRNNYWMPVKADELPYPLDVVAFDTAVNMGVGTAILLLKQAEGRTGDDMVDARTLAALSLKTWAQIMAIAGAMIDLRDARYRQIAASSHDLSQFLRGWLNRDNALRHLIGLPVKTL